jgi:hypothetical protein
MLNVGVSTIAQNVGVDIARSVGVSTIARNVGADKRLVESSEFYTEVKRSLSPLKSLFYVKQNAFEER